MTSQTNLQLSHHPLVALARDTENTEVKPGPSVPKQIPAGAIAVLEGCSVSSVTLW